MLTLFATFVTFLKNLYVAAEVVNTGTDIFNKIKPEKFIYEYLRQCLENSFKENIFHLAHFTVDGHPVLLSKEFIESIEIKYGNNLHGFNYDELVEVLTNEIVPFILLPGSIESAQNIKLTIKSIVEEGVSNFIKNISNHSKASTQRILKQASDNNELTAEVNSKVEQLSKDFSKFTQSIDIKHYFPRTDASPPNHHTIHGIQIENPFVRVRAEDFNHNYEKLSRLFHDLPEWSSIQSRTENVFLIGGRGTGKSMILRRLSIQASAINYINNNSANISSLPIEYFGIYLKLTRGNYEANEILGKHQQIFIAQQELNIEIFDAFTSALIWLKDNNLLVKNSHEIERISKRLGELFYDNHGSKTFEDLTLIKRDEQNKIKNYIRNVAFNNPANYTGNAQNTTEFIKQLCEVFREEIKPSGKEMRIFLLLDEFESLIEIQQIAINTIIKMRLPDLSVKVGVRSSGIKTRETFTTGEPIQSPRDFTEIKLDHDINSLGYSDFLKGIAQKRLEDASYPYNNIKQYLDHAIPDAEASETDIVKELELMWHSGNRRNELINKEFTDKYRKTAIIRALHRQHKQKVYFGFDQFVRLSSGITSNFIELCKLTFFYALDEQIDLHSLPLIPVHIQNGAVYKLSGRLFSLIGESVPQFGTKIHILITALGQILRARLINHSSEPEANRLSITNYNDINLPQYKEISSVLSAAVTWSILHLQDEYDGAYQTRNNTTQQSKEVIINRIYCPQLKMSYNTRWRVSIELDDLQDLISDNVLIRQNKFKELMKKIGRETSQEVYAPTLFDEEP